MDSVFDMSFNCVGSLSPSCSESGGVPGIKHISGFLSHLPDYLFIFRLSRKFKEKKSKEEVLGRNQERAI